MWVKVRCSGKSSKDDYDSGYSFEKSGNCIRAFCAHFGHLLFRSNTCVTVCNCECIISSFCRNRKYLYLMSILKVNPYRLNHKNSSERNQKYTYVLFSWTLGKGWRQKGICSKRTYPKRDLHYGCNSTAEEWPKGLSVCGVGFPKHKHNITLQTDS